ncbi:hypothetical protein PIB30_054737 [Stylosanthes scabra]|uniref:Uncharacterized protein n=1 Tax=Stylosanthes scabra TaxID=79078 RepID=A0ABU6SIS0_9FABA|nr:hypothetical protein [Stylosanthes scabra]
MDCYNPSSTSCEFTCSKHPSSSSVGICAFCLKDRLLKLVCSDCGQQRLSSCSCSDKNHYPPFLDSSINNKKESNNFGSKFWKIGKLFRKNNNKKEKEYYCGRSVCGFDGINSNGDYISHVAGAVSRSRSLCSFRGGGLFESEDGTDSVVPSGARSSISAARSSGVNGGLFLESGRRSGYSEATEPRKSGFDGLLLDSSSKIIDGGGGGGFYGVKGRVFSLRESDFMGMDESSFIDLKLDYSSESRAELFPSSKMIKGDNFNVNTLSAFGSTRHGGGSGVDDGESLTSGGGGSWRISGRGRRSMKGWRWIFRYSNSTNRGGARNRDQQDIMFNA